MTPHRLPRVRRPLLALDAGGRREREPRDQLRGLVPGLRVLHLGRRLPADRGRVELRRRGRPRAARIPLGRDAAFAVTRLLLLRDRRHTELQLAARGQPPRGRRTLRPGGPSWERLGVEPGCFHPLQDRLARLLEQAVHRLPDRHLQRLRLSR